jgi:hypothetical protein
MVWKYIPGCLGIANVVVQTVMLLTQTPNHFPGWRLDAAGGRAAFTLATLGASVILTSVVHAIDLLLSDEEPIAAPVMRKRRRRSVRAPLYISQEDDEELPPLEPSAPARGMQEALTTLSRKVGAAPRTRAIISRVCTSNSRDLLRRAPPPQTCSL